jgi:hypothetical protein
MSLNKGYLTAKQTPESDLMYTPSYAVEPLVKYLKLLGKPVIWCPFDTKESNYVKVLSEYFTVISTHIDDGKDFFIYEPEHYDIIISNPPFSQKDAVLKRLYELNKPYAMLFPVPTLQGVKRFKYMKDIQYLGFDKRINFYKDIENTTIQKSVSFGSCYLCKNFLPRDLIIEELNRG